MQNAIQKIYEYLAANGINIVIAILIFVIGRWLAKLLAGLLRKILEKAKVDAMLVSFAGHLSYVLMLVFVIVAALEKAGVDMSPAVVALGAAGLAIALAWQGSLSNFASGVLMVIFKPLKIGDFVDIAGTAGTVKDMQMLVTVLDAPDNVRIIVPNSQITGSSIKNYTSNPTRRVEVKVAISYSDDIEKAKKVIYDVLANDSRILKDPTPKVAVMELADSGINLVVRPWTKTADYWNVYFDTIERVKVALEENGMTIPFPQHDVHIKSGSTPQAN